MTSLRYLTPFVFLALVPLGASLGGAWTFSAAIAIPLLLTGLDAALGKEDGKAKATAGHTLRWLPRIYVVLQLAVTAWLAFRIARTGAGFFEAAGLTLSNGLTTGVFGMVASHEMVHSRDRAERGLGLLFLASVVYLHFSISHVYGHHRRAATAQDPASARLGEGLYAFLYRSIAGQFREAWDYEARRRLRAGYPVVGSGNRMIVFLMLEALILVAIGIASRSAMAFVIVNASLGIILLETFNYVAHYGLSRRAADNGLVERLGPQHSWNSSNWMNNSALFNMGRHSDHHRHTTRHYQRLEPVCPSPELPSGYAAAMVVALVPPLWRRSMDWRVLMRFESAETVRRDLDGECATRAAAR